TSGEPVSPGLRSNFLTTSALRSAARAIFRGFLSCLCRFEGGEFPRKDLLSQPPRPKTRSVRTRAAGPAEGATATRAPAWSRKRTRGGAGRSGDRSQGAPSRRGGVLPGGG